MKTNPSKRITRLQFGKLLNEAWGKSATTTNAISAFRATGICPYNPESISAHAYLLPNSDDLGTAENTEENVFLQIDATPVKHISPASQGTILFPQPGPSSAVDPVEIEIASVDVALGTMLNQISPVPEISNLNMVKSRRRHVATLLYSKGEYK